MTSFDRLFKPESPDGKATHLQEGFAMGWVPGIITSLEDPEGLGRIRAKCDLIDSSANLPNADDALVWVGKQYTINAVPGGTEVLLDVGLQVALLPMLGDPRQMLLLCCINSRVDRPHPLFSRKEGIYGSVSLHEVYDIKNDQEQSRIQTYPHGVTQAVTKTGDTVTQTQGGASQVLKQDGNILIQNPKAGLSLDAKGEIVHSTESGARSHFDSNGKITIENAFGGKLLLLEGQSKMTGPPTSLAGLMGKAKGIGGILGKALSTLKSLKGISLEPTSIAAAITEGTGLLQSLAGAAKELSVGGGIMGALSGLPITELIYATQPQLALASSLGIPELASNFGQLISGKTSVTDIVKEVVNKAIERNIGIQVNEVTALVTSLKHSPERLTEALTSLFVPGGFEGIANLAGMGVLQKLPSIEQSLQKINTSQAPDPNLFKELRSHFEDSLHKFLGNNAIAAAVADDDPVAYLLAQIQLGQIQELQEIFTESQSLLAATDKVQQVFSSLETENYHQLFNTTTDLSQEIPELATTFLGDRPINQWGDIEVGETDLGTLLGDFNPGAIDLSSLDPRVILSEYLSMEVDLTEFGGNGLVTLDSLLSGIDIGAVNIPALLETPIENILNLGDIKIDSLFPGATYADVSGFGIADIKLSDLLNNAVLPIVDAKDLLDKANLSKIPLSSIFGGSVGQDSTVADVVASTQSEVSLANIPLSSLVDNLSAVDLTTANLKISPPGEIKSQQLAELATTALSPLTQKLDNLLSLGLQSLNKAVNGIPSLGSGSKLELGQVGGELISQYGRHRVFANLGGAGVSTPYGSFSLGAGGGGMFSRGSMAMGVIEKLSSKAAGIFLSPRTGITLAETDHHVSPNQWSFSDAKIQLHDGGIRLQSAKENGELHIIDVLPTGIFIDGFEIFPYFHNYRLLMSRLDTLENNIAQYNQTPGNEQP